MIDPSDWGEGSVSLPPGEKTELQAGMCSHLQSGVRLEDSGAAVPESFIVTANDGERLCDSPRELIVIG